MRHKTLSVFSVLALAILACRLNVNLPINRLETGPTITESITLPDPNLESGTPEVRLEFGGGRLSVHPGDGENLISGTAIYNVKELQPVITQSGEMIVISQGNLEFDGLPSVSGLENEWDLGLSEAPLSLRVMAGAYEADFELGGLSISELHITDGAASSTLNFAEQNKVPMAELVYETGASKVHLLGLGNANLDTLTFRGGAGEYRFDFTGQLRGDLEGAIDAGLSSLTVIVPAGVPAVVRLDGSMAATTIRGDWAMSGQEYTQTGQGPTIRLNIILGAGSLTLGN